MGDRLRVDYAAVEGLIGDMKGYEGNIEDLYSDMTTTVGSLVSNGYMEAESATAYVEEFKNMLGCKYCRYVILVRVKQPLNGTW